MPHAAWQAGNTIMAMRNIIVQAKHLKSHPHQVILAQMQRFQGTESCTRCEEEDKRR
jgi:hypothetical protein